MSNTDNDSTDSNTRVYQHNVVRYLTDHPGQVVYAAEIAEALGIGQDKVGPAVRRLLNKNPDIAADVKIIIPAQAWQYLPNKRAISAIKSMTAIKATAGSSRRESGEKITPLTTSLRTYFQSNAGRVIYLDELCDAMSLDDTPLHPDKLRVGINNARNSNAVFRDRLTTVVAGQAWQYVERAGDATSRTASTPKQSATSAAMAAAATAAEVIATYQPTDAQLNGVTLTAPVAAPAPVPANDSNLMILERLGTAGDGSIMVRDENKVLYRLLPM